MLEFLLFRANFKASLCSSLHHRALATFFFVIRNIACCPLSLVLFPLSFIYLFPNQYASALLLKAAGGTTLSQREARTLRRTAKDLVTVVPVVIILIIPLSPVSAIIPLISVYISLVSTRSKNRCAFVLPESHP